MIFSLFPASGTTNVGRAALGSWAAQSTALTKHSRMNSRAARLDLPEIITHEMQVAVRWFPYDAGLSSCILYMLMKESLKTADGEAASAEMPGSQTSTEKFT